MRILFMGNNRVGLEVLRWLKAEGEDFVGLVLPPPERRKFGDEILRVSGFSEADIVLGSTLRNPETVDRIRKMAPDVILSVLFDYILKPELIEIPKLGCINLHPSLLSYNRGQYPNVWSIVERTPSGVTLHYIDQGIDTGDIIAQKEVPIEPIDTGETLYRKLENACIELFIETWPAIQKGCAPRTSQKRTQGTYHRTEDVDQIDRIDLDATYTGWYLIDVLRARTFPPYKGAYFDVDGRRIYIRLELKYEEEL